MNIILNGVPIDVNINGRSYLINSDFRVGIRFEQMACQLDDTELKEKALRLYYPIIPEDETQAVNALIWFYRCGNEPHITKSTGGTSSKPIFDYDFDAQYIYAAFLQQYSIDLTNVSLHWWKFRALFLSLSPDVTFSKIMSYRNANTANLKGEEKKRLEELKQIYKLPTPAKTQENILTIRQRLLTTGKLT